MKLFRRVLSVVLGVAWMSVIAAGCRGPSYGTTLPDLLDYHDQGGRYGYYDQGVAAQKEADWARGWGLPVSGR